MEFLSSLLLFFSLSIADGALHSGFITQNLDDVIKEDEVERLKFETELIDNLRITEYGTFDFGAPEAYRDVRLCGVWIPRSIEVLLRLSLSPVLRQSPFNNISALQVTFLRHFNTFKQLSKIERNGATYNTIVDILSNNVPAINQAKELYQATKNWPTYLDNVAAYTNLWQNVANIFSVELNYIPVDIKRHYEQHPYYYYTSQDGETLMFKFRITLDLHKCKRLASLLGHWRMDNLPVSDDFIERLEYKLNSAQRHLYSRSDFYRISSKPLFSNLPTLDPQDSISRHKLILEDSKRVALATIKFMQVFLRNLLELCGIPAFSALRHGHWYYRNVPIASATLIQIRRIINQSRLDGKLAQRQVEITPEDKIRIEEVLYESSAKYNNYWGIKNDSIYNRHVELHFDTTETQAADLYFEPDRFIRTFLSLRGAEYDFTEVRDILHSIINATTPRRKMFNMYAQMSTIAKGPVDIVREQYAALSTDSQMMLRASARCLMAMFYLFGISDSKGNVNWPNGWPRNVKFALENITIGVGASCGLCNSLLGFLAAIGYPGVRGNLHSWEVNKNTGESIIYQMFAFGSHVPNTPIDPPGSRNEDPNARVTRANDGRDAFDGVLLSYLSGYYKHDDSAALAYAYYIYSGMGLPNRLLRSRGIQTGIERSPGSVGDRCLEAIPYAIEAARSAMRSRVDFVNFEGNDEYKSKKYAEFVKKLSLLGDTDGLRVMGDFYYVGHEAGGIEPNVSNALDYWQMAADRGDTASALTVANHFITQATEPGTDDRSHLLRIAERYLRMVLESGNNVAATTARYYLARYGLGEPRDPIAAARWLRESADRGDVNSQLLMAHAYTGIMPDIVPEEGKNIFLALEYYKRAAKTDNMVAKFNTAVLTLHGYNQSYTTALERCNASYQLFTQVGTMSLVPSMVRAIAARAQAGNDEVGKVLAHMYLSEMGNPKSHTIVAKHFAPASMPKPLNLCFPHDNAQHEVSSCHFWYARRSGHDPENGSPLFLAQALLSGNPWDPKQAVTWAYKASNDIRGKFLYGTMLEVGLGTKQDCQGAWNIYLALFNSKQRQERLLGLFCIFRMQLMAICRNVPWLYDFVKRAYSRYAPEDLTPCKRQSFEHVAIDKMVVAIITMAFAIILVFSIVVYWKM
ncbi:bifunctional Tetratricopeptide-like helical domain superfamily/Sel1-like repeat [Babesia duncani]|uniref:Bifunctional Tetratricopeptide-like helical domain superfamily/Sel1-like repeat n=1 Tax=Babesia duncani TaxID=323732 RepID=A0AAD9UN87_9APIC|nr:bifunctional Tetratricopeptide-like helical domain superfamily/Sel1-like repeat [Babesia duncani]